MNDDISINFEKDAEIKKIREEVLKRFSEYKKTMDFMAADAPISILCLPSSMEKILISNGCFRVYDLFDLDFTKIKGFGDVRIRNLTTSLDKFLSML